MNQILQKQLELVVVVLTGKQIFITQHHLFFKVFSRMHDLFKVPCRNLWPPVRRNTWPPVFSCLFIYNRFLSFSPGLSCVIFQFTDKKKREWECV